MKHYLLLIFFVLILPEVSAQYGTQQEEALRLYNEGNYSDALQQFKKLITLFPKDPRYFYYAGICMVKSNTDLKKATEYLSFASEKAVSRDVYFYLGEACQYQYQFNKALAAFEKFQQFGNRKDKEALECDLHIQMARNALAIAGQKVETETYRIDSVNSDKLFDFYNHTLRNGKFEQKKEKILSFANPEYTSWRYIPLLRVPGQKVFESGFSLTRNQRDLYVTELTQQNEWSRASNLGKVINSDYDEDYVYFNEAEPALYFASKGHQSMGGYDIFKSVYNADTKTWSEPQNLGFPINSPYDDILFVPSDDQKTAMFASNRATSGKSYKIYTIRFSGQYTAHPMEPGDDYTGIARLKQTTALKQDKIPAASPTGKNDITKTKVTPVPVNNYPSVLLNHAQYNDWLNSALIYQLQSDSISRAADVLKEKLAAVNDETQKRKLRDEIRIMEKASAETQVKANELYEKARAYEMEASPKKKDNQPVLTDEMAKNAFKNTDIPKQHSNQNTQDNRTGKPGKPFVYEFDILRKSPYRTNEDIPLDRELPGGIIYKIQMGAFSKPIAPEQFKGISPISGESIRNGEITKYYAGLFSRMTDAQKALNRIKEQGFRDAFIVSYFNGKYIPINRAIELEKEN